MSILELINMITEILEVKYPSARVYKEEVVHDFEEPYFFVTCLDSEQNKIGQVKYSKISQINVKYYMKNPKRIELLQVGEELQELLQKLKTDEEILIGKDVKLQIVNNVLEVFCKYNQNFIQIEKQEPYMQNLNMKEGVN